jgi:hypothetical protein
MRRTTWCATALLLMLSSCRPTIALPPDDRPKLSRLKVARNGLRHRPVDVTARARVGLGAESVTLAAEDRCHLNGLALVDGQPKYVTALGESDTANGWRANKPRGGCLMEVSSGEVISRGLSMPHSPRWHDGRLWVLESGTGQLVRVEPTTGRPQGVAELPGFARGLALSGAYAFVGLSKIRKTSAMDGVPLAERREQLTCGVAVVDLRSGQVVGLLEFQTAVEEIFDVQLLGGMRFPEVMGFQKDAIHHTFVVPPEERPPQCGGSTQFGNGSAFAASQRGSN